MEIIYIPFGNDCSVAYQLEKHKKRYKSYPFDWIKSSIRGIEKCIQDDFLHFTNKNYFIGKNISENFQLINDKYHDAVKTNTIRMVNNYYGFHHLHDFEIESMTCKSEISECFEKKFVIFKEKYDKRIQRFLQLMNNSSVKKILVHIGPESDRLYLQSNIVPLFESKSYSNYHFEFIPYTEFERFKTSDWKRNEYPWTNIFV